MQIKPRPADNISNKLCSCFTILQISYCAPNCNKPRYIQIIFKRCAYRKPNNITNMFHDKQSVNKISRVFEVSSVVV